MQPAWVDDVRLLQTSFGRGLSADMQEIDFLSSGSFQLGRHTRFQARLTGRAEFSLGR
jgi:hypothetical protein